MYVCVPCPMCKSEKIISVPLLALLAGSLFFSPPYCMPGGRTKIIQQSVYLCSYLCCRNTEIPETMLRLQGFGEFELRFSCLHGTCVLPTELFPRFLFCSFKSRNFVYITTVLIKKTERKKCCLRCGEMEITTQLVGLRNNAIVTVESIVILK